ncbi:hypothetical protein YC2023_020362 [Brassica napus]
MGVVIRAKETEVLGGVPHNHPSLRERRSSAPAGARRRSRSEMARLVEASGGSRILDLTQIQAQSATRSRSRAPRAITDLSRLAGGPEETKTL